MATNSVPADDLAKGIIPTAKQSLRDLFVWKKRVVTSNDQGESHCEWQELDSFVNPVSLLAQLSFHDWVFFLVGWAAWTADAFDFHALSIQTVKLAKYYGRTKTDVTTAITLSLLLRSVGAAVFGLASDKWGRKWPMVANMIILGVLQIATIYSKTFSQFLAVRSLFGLFMGGVFGNAVAMALEHCPAKARGIVSGILHQGYSLAYVFAACANLGVGGGVNTWKTVFWIGGKFYNTNIERLILTHISGGISIGVGILRMFFPESRQFIEAHRAASNRTSGGAFWRQTKRMLVQEWRICVYCTFLMTWFNFYAHTSQDSYTTFLLTEKELDNAGASRASILMKTGAFFGGTTIGYLSQFIGRRRSIVIAITISGLLIPAWILPQGERALSVTAFFMQFFVSGAYGVIPIHLNELSPIGYRATFPGVTYQVGNMISSPAAQIVNAISEKIYIRSKSGHSVEAYGPVMGIASGIIALGIAVTTMLGPEKHGKEFEELISGTEDRSLSKAMDIVEEEEVVDIPTSAQGKAK
ncbi:hypothetical protein ACCO45_008706 [Purpureocillium lilacinum]|uniref:Uncharacterized protein n=1 Tax=Purpureocillium lilacinum TaxID=33203 RepID=A0ACC4DQ39_PURLI